MSCSNLIAIIDVLITAILTAIIIFQTHNLNKKQIESDEKNNQREIESNEKICQIESELQKRQIQIDTFPYKREIYKNTFAVFEFCNYLKKLSSIIDLNKKTGKEISIMLSHIREKYVPDTNAVLWNLREAEYILPDNISKTILDIRSRFDDMCSNIISIETIEAVLTDIEKQELFPETKIKLLKVALSQCDEILSNVRFIESILPKELDISRLNK